MENKFFVVFQRSKIQYHSNIADKNVVRRFHSLDNLSVRFKHLMDVIVGQGKGQIRGIHRRLTRRYSTAHYYIVFTDDLLCWWKARSTKISHRTAARNKPIINFRHNLKARLVTGARWRLVRATSCQSSADVRPARLTSHGQLPKRLKICTGK